MTEAFAKPATAIHWLGGVERAMPVVFIHGLGADRYAWAANGPALFDSYAVYAVDLPGHGSAGSLQDNADLPLLADDVAAALEPKFSTPYCLVGHSLGGAVALSMGKRYSERIAQIVVIAPAGLGRNLDQTFLRCLPDLKTVEDARSLLERLVALPRHIRLPMAQHLLASLEVPGRRDDLRAYAGILSGLERRDVPQVQATWIWGALDSMNPLDADGFDASVDSINVIPDAGHMPQIESATKVNRLIRLALSRC
ncbi:alpha/beta fold hydrolase [Pelagibacterium lentulum]|uniref:AB hydrolase-1 domain-containing protein n=1 Tax=Pelagibacterium lentulum TaxID=2029865 RepID=A0A916RDE7_9HYPH|nr:alpha/beta fold hydrolase [Pelagibacterium lentulum]GGA48340.1 hypothetical protein GCM10011499_17800 [Pelagibacterium lentulum]